MIKIKNLFSLLFAILTSTLFAQHENGNKRKIDSIFASTKIEFIGGSMVLTQESMIVLSKTAKSLHAFPNYKYRITGYARSRGDLVHNQILSKNRASQVKNILISKGIDASSLTTKGIVGIKEKKRQARKRKVSLSYIDFKLIEKTNKKSLKNNSQTQLVSTNDLIDNNKELSELKKKTNKADTQKESKKTLEEYLIVRSEISANKQEKERAIRQDELHEKARLQRVTLKNQKSRINVFFSMNQISFQENSSVLNDEAIRILYKTAEFMSFYSNFQYNIIGHTDKSINEEQNILLSKNRAKSVKSFLVNKGGIDSSILFVLDKGSTEPIASNNSKNNKALNRRVGFSIVE
ncbi:MAG TPA: OmpA family protein [Lutibacter sp.]|nr:OmpA family protein [Lutibacter sp.]